MLGLTGIEEKLSEARQQSVLSKACALPKTQFGLTPEEQASALE